jgi:hypothetical protein
MSYSDPTASVFDHRDLRGFAPCFLSMDPNTGEARPEALAGDLGVPEVWFDVTGYWPYAEIKTDYSEDPASNVSGIAVNLDDAHSSASGGTATPTVWLIGTDSAARRADLGGVELENRIAGDSAEVATIRKSAAELHRIDAKVNGYSQQLFVQVGGTYTLGNTGYSFTVESFNPAFPMSGTGELVQALTLRVTSKAPAVKREFRRMILGGRALQTDFALNVAGAGPMGKRQKAPLDNDLVLLYTLNDPYQLLPLEGREKHTLITSSAAGIVDIAAGAGEGTVVRDLPSTGGQILIAPAEDDASHTPFALNVDRKEHLRKNQSVVEVPSVQRDRETGQAGIFQVLRVRVTSGKWSKDVLVPYSQYVAEESWNDSATQDGRTVAGSEMIEIPGAHAALQLRLGQEYDWLPARLTLDRFDAVPYDGMGSTGSSLMRDFCSTLTIEDHRTGEKTTDVAHMNHPVYFGDGSWLFFQAQWDPEGQRWTILGVGNRPGVPVMIGGCVMIVVGVLYAFYVKPVIIRRMKEKAIRKAGEKKASVEMPVELSV